MSKKKIAIIVFISVFIVAILPYALEVFIFRNKVCSVLDNGEWGGFLGSYIGGALGGIGTLLAVYITTKETRKIQQENLTQIEDEKNQNEKKERKQFADVVAKDIAMYITDINKYFYANHALEPLYSKKRELDSKLNNVIRDKYNILKNIVDNADTEECLSVQNKLEELKQEESELKYRIEINLKEMEQNKADRTIANECYFLLKIKLQNIESGTDILKQIEFIHDNSPKVWGTDFNFIDKETNKLLNMTVQFVDKYVNKKLI